MKPKKPKGPSLKQVAKAYKRTHKQKDSGWDGSRMFNSGAKPHGLGSSTSTNTYKPKAKSITLGGTSKSGKGTTKRKIGRA
jgi:hypothetical protein